MKRRGGGGGRRGGEEERRIKRKTITKIDSHHFSQASCVLDLMLNNTKALFTLSLEQHFNVII